MANRQDGDVGWYAYSCLYLAAPPAVRKKVSRQAEAHYRRIQKLPPILGMDLDFRSAPFFVVRWIGWGSRANLHITRYVNAVEHRERRGCWPSPADLGNLSLGPAADADPKRLHELRELVAAAVEKGPAIPGRRGQHRSPDTAR
jgi:hypothetical protein